MKGSFGQRIDEYWCGNTQIPAKYLGYFSEKNPLTNKMAKIRCLCILALLIELVSYVFIILGLSDYSLIFLFICGVFLKVIGGLGSSVLQNLSGSIWSLELRDYLAHLKSHSNEVNSILANQGCS